MNDFDQAFLEFQTAAEARRSTEDWLAAFETALASRDAVRIGASFHAACHWRDVLAFTWNQTPVAGRDDVATRLTEEQEHTAARGFLCLRAANRRATSNAWGPTARGDPRVHDGVWSWSRHRPPFAGIGRR